MVCSFVFSAYAMHSDERNLILARTERDTTELVSGLRSALNYLDYDIAESFSLQEGIPFSDGISERAVRDALAAVSSLHVCVRDRLSLCSEHRDSDPVLLGVRAVLTNTNACLFALQQQINRAASEPRSACIQAHAEQDKAFNSLNTLFGIFSGQPYTLPADIEQELPCKLDDVFAGVVHSVAGRYAQESSLIDIQTRCSGPEQVVHAVAQAHTVADEVAMRGAIATRDIRPVLAALSQRVHEEQRAEPAQPSSLQNALHTLQRVCTILHGVGEHFGPGGGGSIDEISPGSLLFLLSPPTDIPGLNNVASPATVLAGAETLVAAAVDEDAGLLRHSTGAVGRWFLEIVAGPESIERLAQALQARPERPSAVIHTVQEFIDRYELRPAVGMITALLRNQSEMVGENLQSLIEAIVAHTDQLAQADQALALWQAEIAARRAVPIEERMPFIRCLRHWADRWLNPGSYSVVSDEITDHQLAEFDERGIAPYIFSRHIGYIPAGQIIPFNQENGFNCTFGGCDHPEHQIGLGMFSFDGAGPSSLDADSAGLDS